MESLLKLLSCFFKYLNILFIIISQAAQAHAEKSFKNWNNNRLNTREGGIESLLWLFLC